MSVVHTLRAAAVRLQAVTQPHTRRHSPAQSLSQSLLRTFPPVVSAVEPRLRLPTGAPSQVEVEAQEATPKPAWALDCACLLLFALCLRLFTFGHAHSTSSDEYFYAVMARDFSNVFSEPGYFTQLRNVDTLHAPGFAFALSVVYFLTNDHTLEVGRYFGMMLNTLTIPFTFALVLAIGYSRVHAFVAAFVLAIVPGFWKDADRVWLDHQATLLVTAFWAVAIWAWRARSLARWSLACALLVAVLFAKEYLFVLIGIALPFGLLEPIGARAWKFAGWAVAMIVVAALLGLYVIAWSGWLPKAKYVGQLVSATAREQNRRVAQHPITRPDLQKLYYMNSEEGDVPALFWMLALAGLARAALDARQHLARLAPVFALSVFALALAAFFSMMKMEFGARLLFPAYPIACVFISVALLEVSLPLVPVIVPLLAAVIWQRSIRSFIEQMHGASFFWEVIGGVSVLFLIASLAHRSSRDQRSSRATHQFAVVMTLLLMFVMSATCVARSARDYRNQVAEMGEQSGLIAMAPKLRRFVSPDDVILSPNPRELAYHLDMKFATIDRQAWLDGTVGDALKHTSAPELVKRRVKWVSLLRPEFSAEDLAAVHAALSKNPWFEEKFKYTIDGRLSFVMFRVHPERSPTHSRPQSSISNRSEGPDTSGRNPQ